MNTVLDGLCNLTATIDARRDERVLSPTEEFSAKFISEAEQAKQQIQQNIAAMDYDRRSISNYLSFLQKKITDLSNKIHEIRPGVAYPGEIVNDLLDFLDLEFESEFNRNLKAPVSYIAAKIAAQAELAKNVTHMMIQAGVDHNLVNLLRDYMTQTGAVIKTFAQLNYYQHVCEHLYNLCIEISKVDFQLRLIQELIYLNFNKLAFLHFCNATFAKQYDEERDLEQWIKEVNTLFRWITRAPQHEALSYDSSDCSVKMRLEQVVLKKLAELKGVEAERREESFFDLLEPFFIMKWTVFEIAFFFRLLNDSDYLDVKYTRFLHAFIAKYVRTENKYDNLSEGSIKNKYYEVSEHTRNSLKKKLTVLLKNCDGFKTK